MQRLLCRGSRIPATRYLLILVCGLAWIGSVIIIDQFGLLGNTGVDLPGEASTIMHQRKNIGQVELATMSFGQSFQVTPIQMATTFSSIINGGNRVTPHFGKRVLDQDGTVAETFSDKKGKRILSEETSATMRALLESVVSEGGGKNAAVEGYRIGGKTATSQTLPRSANKYISSFVGFAPADDPADSWDVYYL